MNGLVDPAPGVRLACIEGIAVQVRQLAEGETGTMTGFVSTRVR